MERWGTVAIVGVGLIGGSVGRCLRARRLARRVVGIGRDPAKLAQARDLGAIDDQTDDLEHGAAGADLIVVCTPVSRIAADCRRVARAAGENVLITDVGSTKAALVAEVETDPASRKVFCGAHPIAGSEKQGVGSARDDLFDGRTCVLTPSNTTPLDRLDRARAFWLSLGCRTIEMSPTQHDEALALTSHLPHVVASAVAGLVSPDLLSLAAGSFRDVTRVASSDPDLWTAIFLANRAPLLRALDRIQDRLDGFRDLLQAEDAEGLASWWTQGKVVRDQFPADSPSVAETSASRGSS